MCVYVCVCVFDKGQIQDRPLRMSTARLNRIQPARTNRAEQLHRAGRQLPGTQVNREEARTRHGCEQTGPCLTPRHSLLMESDAEKKRQTRRRRRREREEEEEVRLEERKRQTQEVEREREREKVWEGRRWWWWGGRYVNVTSNPVMNLSIRNSRLQWRSAG